jgi:hypothetical protein
MPELNPELVAWNKTNQERRKKLSAEFQHNLKREDVSIIAGQRQRRHFRLESSTYETFRCAPSYEWEVRAIVEELAYLPLYQAQKTRAGRQKLKVGETEGNLGWNFLGNLFENGKSAMPDRARRGHF